MALTLVVVGIVFHRLGAQDVAGKTPSATSALRSPLRYPDRVDIPDDVASVAVIAVPVKSGDPEEELVYIPGANYLEAHYDGWQECLSRVAEGRFDRLDNWLPASPRQSWVETYELRGTKDGFHACAAAVRELRDESVPDESLRRMAASEFLKRGRAPLVRDAEGSGRGRVPDRVR
jgi:hypothetical protein